MLSQDNDEDIAIVPRCRQRQNPALLTNTIAVNNNIENNNGNIENGSSSSSSDRPTTTSGSCSTYAFSFPVLLPPNSIPITENRRESDTFRNSTLCNIRLKLDKASREYTAGENITGRVNIYVPPRRKLMASEITVRFLGKVRINGKLNGVNNTGHETLFDILALALGPEKSSIEIPPGRHGYPFSIQVPTMSFPKSSEIPDVEVLYRLEATVVHGPQRSISDPKSKSHPISIASVLDLNQVKDVRNPVNLKKTKRFFSSCLYFKPLMMRVRAPKSGCIPGDHFHFSVEIDNKSRKVIHNLTAKLIQTCTISSYNTITLEEEKKKIVNLLQTESRGKIGAGENVEWEMTFTIPPSFPPSTDPAISSKFSLEYKIEVDSSFGTGHTSLAFPIYVGTIPLKP